MSVGRHKRRQLCGRHLRSICSILTRCRIVLGFPRRYEISQVGCQDGSWSHRNAASCISGCDGALNVQPLSLISSEYDKVYLKPTARHAAGKSFDLVITRNCDGLGTPRNCSRVVCECVGVSTCEGAKKAAVQPWSSLVPGPRQWAQLYCAAEVHNNANTTNIAWLHAFPTDTVR